MSPAMLLATVRKFYCLGQSPYGAMRLLRIALATSRSPRRACGVPDPAGCIPLPLLASPL